MQTLPVMKILSICTNSDFSTGHWRGCDENTALGWSGTHLLLPPTLTWDASSLAKVPQCSLSLLGNGDSGTHTYTESQGNTHTLLPTCTDILCSWLTPDRTEVKMSLTSFLWGLAEPKYFSSAVSPLTTHFIVVITLRTVPSICWLAGPLLILRWTWRRAWSPGAIST